MARERIPIRVNIESGVEGVRNIQTLARELRALREQGRQQIQDPTRRFREQVSLTEDAVGRLRGALGGLVATGTLIAGVRQAVRAFSQLETTLRGLEGVATVTGVGVREAFDVATEISEASDGLISFRQAAQSVQNLLQGGAGLDQARDTILALADASAVARSSQFSLGEAVVEGTEAIRLGSSQRLDNAGITRNLSDLEQDYAASLGVTTDQLTEYQIQQARLLGVQKEAEIFTGQLNRATQSQAAEFDRARNSVTLLAQSIGEVLTPAISGLVTAGRFVLDNFVRPLIAGVQELTVRIADFVNTGSFQLSSAAEQSIARIQDRLLAAQTDLQQSIAEGAAAADEARRDEFRQRLDTQREDPRAAARAERARQRRERAEERARQRRLRAQQREAEEQRRIEQALLRARTQLATLTGTDTEETRRQAIALQFADLRRDLEARSDAAGLELIENLINVQAAEAEFSRLEQVLARGLDRIQDQQSVITSQQAAGLLTESQARQQIVALQEESAELIRQTIPLLEKQAAVLGPEAQADVARWTAELERAQIVVNETALRFRGEFTDALSQFFVDIGEGSKSAGEAFRDFGRTVLSTIQRILAQRLAEKLVGGLFGGGGSGGGGGLLGGLFGGGGGAGGGLGSLFSRLFGFAEGGAVSGPGTSTSDSIPARLSAGEYVVRADAVRALGVGLLDRLNALSSGAGLMPAPLRFQDGGVVPELAPAAAPAGIRVVNVLDPGLAGDYLESSAGERSVLNIIERNRGTVSQIVGGR